VKSKQQLEAERLERVTMATAIAGIENRVREAGCTDDCENCKLEFCAREGTAAIVGDMGDIQFLK
jgi:predicted nucleic acid binding AN1-type Zn finger protein